MQYRSADLAMDGVDDCIDITDMNCYSDDEFSAVLCSHVLEHVPDDVQALREIYRILKPGAWGILLVPIYLPVEFSVEEPEPLTEIERCKLFGQSDHVRLYGKKGFIARIEQAGLQVSHLSMSYFGQRAFRIHGISPTSALYLISKPA